MDDVLNEVQQRANLAMSNEMEMLTFYLRDEQLYGMNVFKIIEILEHKAITKIPGSHDAILGTIDFRGRPISLIDLSYALDLGYTDYENNLAYILVCEYSDTTQGFLVSRPNVLITKGWKDIIKPDGMFYDSTYLTAITYHQDETVQILDVEKILVEITGITMQVDESLLQEAQRLHAERHHVLCVDDSKAACELLRTTLDQMDIQHTILEDAQKAYDTLEKSVEDGGKSPYTMVISDLEMPGMDGFSLTRKIKANPKLAGIHVAIHSSLSNRSNQVKAQQMGADDFIPKFMPNSIVKSVLAQITKSQEAAN
ncbi:MAG: chemotaxis protein CheV [Magnetococcales bacterium]|nr:chemotaxis protein CheV [Magnetococcales bacterium]